MEVDIYIYIYIYICVYISEKLFEFLTSEDGPIRITTTRCVVARTIAVLKFRLVFKGTYFDDLD
jgi:hypothetical protein